MKIEDFKFLVLSARVDCKDYLEKLKGLYQRQDIELAQLIRSKNRSRDNQLSKIMTIIDTCLKIKASNKVLVHMNEIQSASLHLFNIMKDPAKLDPWLSRFYSVFWMTQQTSRERMFNFTKQVQGSLDLSSEAMKRNVEKEVYIGFCPLQKGEVTNSYIDIYISQLQLRYPDLTLDKINQAGHNFVIRPPKQTIQAQNASTSMQQISQYGIQTSSTPQQKTSFGVQAETPVNNIKSNNYLPQDSYTNKPSLYPNQPSPYPTQPSPYPNPPSSYPIAPSPYGHQQPLQSSYPNAPTQQTYPVGANQPMLGQTMQGNSNGWSPENAKVDSYPLPPPSSGAIPFKSPLAAQSQVINNDVPLGISPFAPVQPPNLRFLLNLNEIITDGSSQNGNESLTSQCNLLINEEVKAASIAKVQLTASSPVSHSKNPYDPAYKIINHVTTSKHPIPVIYSSIEASKLGQTPQGFNQQTIEQSNQYLDQVNRTVGQSNPSNGLIAQSNATNNLPIRIPGIQALNALQSPFAVIGQHFGPLPNNYFDELKTFM